MKKKFVDGLKVALLIPLPLGVSVLSICTILFGGVGKDIAITLAIISVALIITAIIAIKLHSKRCKKCGKWNALEEIKAKEIERREVTRRKILKEYHRNKGGELIGTVEKEIYVPRVEISYEITKRCKFCGHISYGYKIIER